MSTYLQTNQLCFCDRPKEQLNFEELVRSKLKTVMMSVDLEQVTSKEIRNKLEAHFQRDLSEYKSYIDKEMIKIMGQMEESSKILDYLYLGSEWNASNFEELKGKGYVCHSRRVWPIDYRDAFHFHTVSKRSLTLHVRSIISFLDRLITTTFALMTMNALICCDT